MTTHSGRTIGTEPSPKTFPTTRSTTRAKAPNRAVWLLPALVFLGTFAVYAATCARGIIHIDAQAATVESWRIAAVGEPWLEHALPDNTKSNKYVSRAANGHVVGQRMAGPVLAGLPFYLLLERGSAPAAFTYTPGALAAAFWTALAVMLMFLAIRTRLTEGRALAVTAAFALTTPTWTISADMLWTHTVTQFALAGAAYAGSRNRWWLTGAFLAIGMLGRPHIAVVAAVVGMGLAWSRRDLWLPVKLGLPTGLALGVLEVWNHWMFGFWSVGGAYSGKAEAAAEGFSGSSEWSGAHAQLLNYVGFLVSPDRGLLVWTPVLLLLGAAVVRSWRDLPDWTKWLALGGVAYTFLQLRINWFPGGDGFYGYRHGLELLTCLTPMLAFSVARVGRVARWLLAPVIAVQAAAITLGAVLEAFYVNKADVWHDNSFWLALRSNPIPVGTWLVLFLLGALSLEILRRRRWPTPYREPSSPPVETETVPATGAP